MKYEIKSFGNVNGQNYDEIYIYHEDIIISFSNLGARINRWQIIQTTGKVEKLIISNQDADQAFENKESFVGASIGRVAGRIGKATFELNDQSYQLKKNENDNHLHGGNHPYDLSLWEYQVIEFKDKISVEFTYTDPDGNNGYPGTIQNKVIHSYDSNHVWTVEYLAETDKDTVFNPTNHVYFNLNGDCQESIANHHIQVSASHYVPVQADGLPVGRIDSVENTPFDLREGVEFGQVLNADHPQVVLKSGFDHPFVFDAKQEERIVVSLVEKQRQLTVKTDCPCVVIYTVNLPDSIIWADGEQVSSHGAFTLETQHLPNAMNEEGFGDVTLKAGQKYYSQTSYHLTY
ncbi:aldose epimerase family protein [Facklamia lactis]|uniref:aldose epimerase family protein n=1 Tax=Facklamia lactis TaxID=2749967 RepID=UPI0018CF5C30|nr:aldose epimerase family protein [Facklamia lactis]MBG9981175.1 galactose mutarotase [Facklamia lactis]